jgi:2,4-dienoyl-CoA reductase-like NADH-dependent reductase (Old Yellow Enzyme family)
MDEGEGGGAAETRCEDGGEVVGPTPISVLRCGVRAMLKASRHRPWHPRSNAYVTPEEGGWMPVGPSAIRFDSDGPTPHELTIPEIHAIRDAFAATAARCVTAGFDLVELHFGHGYLGHSFLSPLMNKRPDAYQPVAKVIRAADEQKAESRRRRNSLVSQWILLRCGSPIVGAIFGLLLALAFRSTFATGCYGGPFDHRVAFLIEAVRAVRGAIPESMPLLVRISATDWDDQGWTLDESVAAARLMQRDGVDLIDCSSGGASRSARITTGPGHQVPFAERIRREAELPTGAVGMITEPAQANAPIEEGTCDIVLLGREMLRDPHWAFRAWRELGAPKPAPIATEYAWAVVR